MKILRQKVYSNLSELGQKFKNSPLLPVATLGLSATSVALSASRNKQLKEQNKEQLKALNRLTNSLNKVDRSINAELDESETKTTKPNKKFSIFKLND